MHSIIPHFAELPQVFSRVSVPRFVEPTKNQTLRIAAMDFKNEIGRRIRRAREEKDWTLEDLSRETGDVLSLKRIAAYEVGARMPGPSEAVTLGKALGKRAAYLMAIDEAQLPINPVEESLVRNWRTLSEKDRMDFFRKIEQAAMVNRDPVADLRVNAAQGKPPEIKRTIAKRRAHRS